MNAHRQELLRGKLEDVLLWHIESYSRRNESFSHWKLHEKTVRRTLVLLRDTQRDLQRNPKRNHKQRSRDNDIEVQLRRFLERNAMHAFHHVNKISVHRSTRAYICFWSVLLL